MKISVIIVNYNVKHFLEQCLNSVLASARHCETEIYVVDNNSVDGSCSMVKEKFPEVHLIENKKNYGFSYANNQAIKISKGEYVLLLNPDTVIEEKTLQKVCDFMDSHPDAGGLGVKMIDGKGRFLPESKRGLPTPEVAFYKIFGVSKLFPKSKKFGKYHLTYLDKEETHVVDVLSGAFMLLRKECLDKTGLLDENFFMYGEDIDMSYRISLAGYKNYYYPRTTIIHYKGESTKKGSINYVLVFYNAMIIFAKKHFSKRHAGTFSALINIAIYIRAAMAITYRFMRSIITPIIDALVIIAGFLVIAPIWSNHIFGSGDAYPENLFIYAVLAYALIWILSLLFLGGYDKPVKTKNIFKGIGAGAIIILVLYSLLPAEFRFSRALILLGAGWTTIVLPLTRFLLHFTGRTIFKMNMPGKKLIAIVGNKQESSKLVNLLNNNNPKIKISAFVNPINTGSDKYFAGTIDQLDEIVRIKKIDEIIFCAKSLQSQQIINTMLKLNNVKLDYKIASPDGISVIGSNSINTTGELYNIDINSIVKPENLRNKRMLDFIIALIFIILLPVLIIFVPKRGKMIKNLFSILFGGKSFVTYCTDKNTDTSLLPKIKNGVFTPVSVIVKDNISTELIERLNMMYAKDYKILQDINIIFKSWRKLGQN
ncbi:MAG: glycosyltransferase [Bacteroidales bacterium]|nr:glycosyltransferase [Bacteroidales bacterium]MDD4215805.1 glycosyltransferase [Bacteroidales bacterium]MDY0142777.1 glycosyltransferase [Bacteroidales bacterium]